MAPDTDGIEMLDFIQSPQFTFDHDQSMQNPNHINEYQQNFNAELPRMQMPGLDFDHTLGLLASPTISDDINGLLGDSDFPATNAVATAIHNHSMTPTPPPFISHQQAADDVQFHVKTKTVFICAYGNCNKEFGRKPELYRHHRSVHKTERPYKCRDTGCLRAVRGFPRADKRDDHERKVHGLRGSRGHGFGANAS